MVNETFQSSMVVTNTAKRLAWAAVIVINLYFVYFSVLRGIGRSTAWQRDYLMACVVQLLIEIFIFETGECIWIYFLIPKLVSDDVATTIASVKAAIDSAFANESSSPVILDSPQYFFVSSRLAAAFPDQFESSVVKAFHSYYPPSELDLAVRSTRIDDNVTKRLRTAGSLFDIPVGSERRKGVAKLFLHRFNASVLLWTVMQHMGTIPMRFQQVIIHTLQPIGVSLVIVLFLYFEKYPVMALLPMGFILFEVALYAYRSGRAEKKQVPAINDSERNSKRIASFREEERSMRESIRELNLSSKFVTSDAGEEKNSESEKPSDVVILKSRLMQSKKSENSGNSVTDPDETVRDVNIQWGECNIVDAPTEDIVRQSEEISASDTWSKSNAINTKVTNRQKLKLLEAELLYADDVLKQFLLASGVKQPYDYKLFWAKDSDEYRYLYQPKITPFVNDQGESVNTFQILMKRGELKSKQCEEFKTNELFASIGIRRREKLSREWDHYRLFKSELMLPFVDESGTKVTVTKIFAAREASKSKETVETLDDDERHLSHDQAEQLKDLRREKQMKEYSLMLLKEEMADEWAGQLVLNKFRSLKKRRDDNNAE
jgi:hypothetical protein